MQVDDEAWAAVRNAYESASAPLDEIGAPFGLSRQRIAARAKKDGWQARPRRTVARRTDDARTAEPTPNRTLPTRKTQRAMIARLYQAINREDMGRDIVMPGAFRASLDERGLRGIKLLFQHDANQPIGVWTAIEEDSRGLYVRGRLMREVEKAREVIALMRAGALDGLSIGFRTVKARRDRASGVRRLDKIDLWEISIVTFPLLPDARIITIKERPFAGAAPTER